MNNRIDDNILSLIENTPNAILRSLSERVHERRLERNWTQKLMAAKAGMPLATYRRFELQGEVSLRGLVMISLALGMENDFTAKAKQRKRGGRNE